MIETYPKFSKLSLQHKRLLTTFAAQFESYSDFNFTSLFCWNDNNTTELSQLNGNLVIRMTDYLHHRPIYSILGFSHLDESLKTLLTDVHYLELVPEAVIHDLKDPSHFKITEDRDNFDYIYNLSHLSNLAGGHFKKKRNKHNTFVRDHQKYELIVRTIDSVDPVHALLLKKIDRQWAIQNSRAEGDILAERKSIDVLLDNFAEFDIHIVEVVVAGELKAFSINEVINNHYAICHFEKALKVHHQNIYTFLVAETARELQKADCHWVNWEQDLGLPGLRKSKQSYHPIKMLKKYHVSLAN